MNEQVADNAKSSRNFDILLLVTFFTGSLLIIATYAWFSANLNVKIDFFNVVASNQNGLYISLDGVNYQSSVQISKETIITGLKNTYPSNANHWSLNGLYPVSSNGIKNSNEPRFNMYGNSRLGYKDTEDSRKKYLNTYLIEENKPDDESIFVAFDIFLKNVTGSPISDNLFLDRGTAIYLKDNNTDDNDGTFNSMRMGILKLGSTDLKADVNTVQTLGCNNNCEMLIYEPNATRHSPGSIERATLYDVVLVDGTYHPTYAVTNAGRGLDLVNGQPGTGVPVDNNYFALQKTITSFNQPIFKIPNGITKVRIYVWVEGQDMDSLETRPKGATVSIVVNFVKDDAGYE